MQVNNKWRKTKPDIYIWDTESRSILAHFNDFHTNGVNNLAFSPDGTLLLTTGLDENNSIAIYDW